MNALTRITISTSIALIFTSATSLVMAAGDHDHSHKHGDEEAQFDPVSTEFGSYAPDMKAVKTIDVSMSDTMRFEPAMITVKVGDVVEFTHSNTGAILHEFVLGTEVSLSEHAEMMKKFPNMEHDEPYMAHVSPGDTGKMLWKFDKPGEYGFACLIPGHYEAGMKGKIIVTN